jgi:hypothetical protein
MEWGRFNSTAITLPNRTIEVIQQHMVRHHLPGSVILSALLEFSARAMTASFLDAFFRNYREVVGDPTTNATRLTRFKKDNVYGLAPVPDRFPSGRYSVVGVAKRFGVSRNVVYSWIRYRLLTGKRLDFQSHHRIWALNLNESTVSKLEEYLARSKRVRPSQILPDRFPDGRWSVPGACKHFGVRSGSVHKWILRRTVRAERRIFLHLRRPVWWLEIPEAMIPRLEQRVAASKRRVVPKRYRETAGPTPEAHDHPAEA